MNTTVRTALRVGAALALLTGTPVIAHHSFAMFEMGKKQTITGKVHTLEWTNPHVWLWVDVTDAAGKVTTYGFEGAAPGEMTRMGGWTKRIVTKGQTVTVEFSPLKDGRPGGTLGKVTDADGNRIGKAMAGGPPGGGPPGGGPPPGAAPNGSAAPGAPPSPQ